MYILILGCMLFGEGQGTKYDASIVEINEIKFFENEDDATTYGNHVIDNGGDSYYLYDENDNINWCGNKRIFNKVQKSLVDWKKGVSLT